MIGRATRDGERNNILRLGVCLLLELLLKLNELLSLLILNLVLKILNKKLASLFNAVSRNLFEKLKLLVARLRNL